MIRRKSIVVRRTLVSAAALAAALVVHTSRLFAQSTVTSDRGAAALGSVLDGLGTTGRVLLIAAHPDDEDTQLIAWLARGRKVETAYLSLTRGDGGQNLIGNELGEALGVIRTQELLSARRIDGGRQFFTRAFDFGFSKNAEETLNHWPRDTILGDVVRVVRAFRPQVIVAVFSGTPRDGHGHHQISGILAREVYDISADTVRFPAAGYGMPWSVSKFYRNARFAPELQTVKMNTGEYDALLGRSYYEISAESRSQHKSQGFGVLQRKGVVMDFLTREASRVVAPTDAKTEQSLLDGVDTTWAHLKTRTARADVRAALDTANIAMSEARQLFRATDPTATMTPLAKALRLLRAARDQSGTRPKMLLAAPNFPQPMLSDANGYLDLPPNPRMGAQRVTPAAAQADAELWDALSLTIERTERALVLASGVAVEATAPRATFPVREPTKRTVNDSLPVAVTVFNRGRTTVSFVGADVSVVGAPNRPQDTSVQNAPRAIDRDSAITVNTFATAVAPTASWWQALSRTADWFRVPISALDDTQQQALTSTAVTAHLLIAGMPIDVVAPVVNRFADPVKGDQQVPVAAVPGITIGLDNAVEYIRADVPVEREFRVHVLSAYPALASVEISIQLPPGLTADSASRTRVLTPEAPGATVIFKVKGKVGPGRLQMGVIARHEATTSFTGYYTIAYDHITPQRMYATSGMWLASVKVVLPPRAHVGYVQGVGDHGMEALRQLDVTVEKLDPSALGSTDLSRFTSIIVGPRAYGANNVLVANNARLLDYAKRGGRLVVQYGQAEMMKPGVMPFPIQLARTAERVTIEDAPVTMLVPTAPLLTMPNKIGADDWVSWVQERATYMPTTADKNYTALLAMNDPGEPVNKNGLLIAPVGKGSYVYVTLALFRQLPNGVPGAARLLMNLINAAPPPPAAPPKMEQ